MEDNRKSRVCVAEQCIRLLSVCLFYNKSCITSPTVTQAYWHSTFSVIEDVRARQMGVIMLIAQRGIAKIADESLQSL